MSNTKQTAAIAAKEDARQTGAAKVPDTKPAAGTKPRLSDQERAERKVKLLADHERLIQARTQNICHFLTDMGVASLAGRIKDYTDVSPEYVEASLVLIEERVAACRAAAKARSATAPAAAKVDLKAVAARITAQKHGAPLQQ